MRRSSKRSRIVSRPGRAPRPCCRPSRAGVATRATCWRSVFCIRFGTTPNASSSGTPSCSSAMTRRTRLARRLRRVVDDDGQGADEAVPGAQGRGDHLEVVGSCSSKSAALCRRADPLDASGHERSRRARAGRGRGAAEHGDHMTRTVATTVRDVWTGGILIRAISSSSLNARPPVGARAALSAAASTSSAACGALPLVGCRW